VKAGDAGYAALDPREPIAEEELRELDRIAQDFTRTWIWFEESPPEETAVERQRFEAYGYAVRAANLRSEVLRKVLKPESGGLAFGSFGDDTRWIAELLRNSWAPR
jgi:hypothetical protein